MSHTANKISYKAWKQIDDILWRVWDPIGVNDLSDARDEYSSYVPPVYAALRAKASDADLNELLRRIETERVGLRDTNGVQRRSAVVALRQVNID